jgi:pimeloyl-ACP methyl ester carboxylesterase
MLIGFAITLLVALAILGGMIIFGTGKPPAAMQALSRPFANADMSSLPTPQTLKARDGVDLTYRVVPAANGAPERVVILIHGATASSPSMHPLAKALAAQNMTVYSLDIRGHGGSGRRGDLDYPAQLDDDLAEIVTFVKAQHPGVPLVLAGFSAGGGFSLHTAATPLGRSFERVVLLAPMLGYRAPMSKPPSDQAPLVTPFVPRIIALTILNAIGIHVFDHLQTLAFGDFKRPELTPNYSFLLMRSFATGDYADDVRKANAPLAVVVGADDDFFFADQFAPALNAVRPGIPVTVLPGLAHIPLIVEPEATPAITRAIRGQA